MRLLFVVLVLLGGLFAATFYVTRNSPSGDPKTAFAPISQSSSVQEIKERFAPRLDPGTLQSAYVQGKILTVPAGAAINISIPARSDDDRYRMMEFVGVTQPVKLSYIDNMKDNKGASTKQLWQWPASSNNAELSASEQGGQLTVDCLALAPKSCTLTFQ